MVSITSNSEPLPAEPTGEPSTITVPWNYQEKLNAMNAMIMEVTGDETKKKTFKGYINDIWNECMNDSDKHVVTGKKPPKPEKKG